MKVTLEPQTEQLTEAIIASAFEVANVLGHGFLEAVYRKALSYEMKSRGLSVVEEAPFSISYKEHDVGTYFADIVVEQKVVVELKAVEKLVPPHIGQVLNYLKASNLKVGLLFNYSKPKLEYRRILF